MTRLTWAHPEDLLAHELVASTAFGRDAAALATISERWESAGGSLVPAVSGASDEHSDLRHLARRLLDELDALPAVEDPAQPEGIEEILAAADPLPLLEGAGDDFDDRVRGGWLGRSAGCVLGKPVEKIPRQGIEEIARFTGNWPITGYFTAVGLPDDVAGRWPWNRRSAPTSLAETISGIPEDDDLNFALLALALAEGGNFDTDDVATLWLNNLPAGRVFTAERAAYRNLLDAWPTDEVAEHRNPFREWIGALIRADVFGWVNPGRPVAAARQAWVDARLTHRRAGVYAAMWSAALCSAAVVVRADDPDPVSSVLAAGVAVVPSHSRFAADVRFGDATAARATSLEAGLDALHERFSGMHWVHARNNAATIAFALRWAARGPALDFGAGIAAAVATGWDTDSTGATVGSVLGAMVGAAHLPRSWIAPFETDGPPSISTSIPGSPMQAVDDLTRRTCAVAQQRLSRGVVL
ncbi:ADP-ribosylglycohydrolase family protein [Tessaracoccus antarcticus]|uniref:ADP-ribosylglycohydrolase family protein n=1 Tax=Tessaracoccus antarcticus TaxID=2479848 RepID=A0A3M0G8X0_9ACTN|nr:ADP-ribosylglycohydrolase family protein [Tessaracoccus antarcticus]RMB61364.1 ADP-ribosylglycohydrolase family protein [Tessaracoccus antarcticus]